MKKFLCLFLSVIMVVSLVACGNNKKDESPAEDNVQSNDDYTVDNVESTEPSDFVDSTDETVTQFWEIRSELKPELDAVTYKEVEIELKTENESESDTPEKE